MGATAMLVYIDILATYFPRPRPAVRRLRWAACRHADNDVSSGGIAYEEKIRIDAALH
jgi:hypothetical protein